MPLNPKKAILDPEEKEIEDNIDFRSAYSEDAREAILAPYRKESKKNVTMRFSEPLIAELKKKAAEEGLPYPSPAAMILMKYVRGALLERDAVREVVKALKA